MLNSTWTGGALVEIKPESDAGANNWGGRMLKRVFFFDRVYVQNFGLHVHKALRFLGFYDKIVATAV